MRITEKIELIKKLTETLRSNYDQDDLKIFFEYYNLKIEWIGWGNDQENYEIDIKNTLSNATEDILIAISNELETGSEYIIKALPDESPIDIRQIVDFIDSHDFNPAAIRKTVENLTWKIQMKRVVDEA